MSESSGEITRAYVSAPPPARAPTSMVADFPSSISLHVREMSAWAAEHIRINAAMQRGIIFSIKNLGVIFTLSRSSRTFALLLQTLRFDFPYKIFELCVLLVQRFHFVNYKIEQFLWLTLCLD
jgi:hypothetical protein